MTLETARMTAAYPPAPAPMPAASAAEAAALAEQGGLPHRGANLDAPQGRLRPRGATSHDGSGATDRLAGFLGFLADHLSARDYAEALARLSSAVALHGLDVARTGQPLDQHQVWYLPLAVALGQAYASVTPGCADD